MSRIDFERYSLRYAAGQYWLLDTRQAGVPYKPPISLNVVGAEIWKKLCEGMNVEQIAQEMSREYDVAAWEIQEDIVQFKNQLNSQGIIVEE